MVAGLMKGAQAFYLKVNVRTNTMKIQKDDGPCRRLQIVLKDLIQLDFHLKFRNSVRYICGHKKRILKVGLVTGRTR